MPIAPEETSPLPPPAGFEPADFWDQHKGKIILYGSLLLIGLIAFAIFQSTKQKRLAEAQRMFANATTAENFREISTRFPKTVVAANAQLLLAGQQRAEKKYDEAVATLKAFVDQHPAHPLGGGAWTSLGATYELQGKTDEALDAYRQAAAKYPSTFSAPLALISQAKLWKVRGRIDEAKRAYENLSVQFPESRFVAEAMRALQELKELPAPLPQGASASIPPGAPGQPAVPAAPPAVPASPDSVPPAAEGLPDAVPASPSPTAPAIEPPQPADSTPTPAIPEPAATPPPPSTAP